MCVRVVGASTSCMKYFIELTEIRTMMLAIPDFEMVTNYMPERLWF
jgi:hypothetical protein